MLKLRKMYYSFFQKVQYCICLFETQEKSTRCKHVYSYNPFSTSFVNRLF